MTKLSSTFKIFFKSEKTGGFLLILCTLLSIVLSNSDFGATYTEFWHTNLGGHDISHWINDCLMSIFFLLIGLELEREVYAGELSSLKNASLPVIAALGGVLVPALIYGLFNYNTPQLKGAGIPMATDIAFAIGVLSLLGNKVPIGLKVFLTALAVIDDLLAIIVIAVFYTNDFSVFHLMLSFLVFGILIVLNRLKIKTAKITTSTKPPNSMNCWFLLAEISAFCWAIWASFTFFSSADLTLSAAAFFS